MHALGTVTWSGRRNDDVGNCQMARLPLEPYGATMIGILIVVALAPVAQNSPSRTLPPTTVGSRDPMVWRATADAVAAAGSTFLSLYPDFEEELNAAKKRIAELSERYDVTRPGVVFDKARAEALIDELYVDAGHPDLNCALQEIVFTVHIRSAASRVGQSVTEGARNALVAGVVQYLRDGGGQRSPAMRARVAEPLDLLAPNDPNVLPIVEEVLADALQWAEEIGDETQLTHVRQAAAKHWGDPFWQHAHELTAGKLPAPYPKAYKDAIQALDALLSTDQNAKDPTLERRLRDAREKALRRFEQNALEDDLTCRLLLAYRIPLDRRPETPEAAVQAINRSLLELAKDSDRLRSERHWKLWAQAVVSLRHKRIAKPLLEFVRNMLREGEKLPDPRRVVLPPLQIYDPDAFVPQAAP